MAERNSRENLIKMNVFKNNIKINKCRVFELEMLVCKYFTQIKVKNETPFCQEIERRKNVFKD